MEAVSVVGMGQGGPGVRAVVQGRCPHRKSRQRAQALSTKRGHRERVATSKAARGLAEARSASTLAGRNALVCPAPACAAVMTALDADTGAGGAERAGAGTGARQLTAPRVGASTSPA